MAISFVGSTFWDSSHDTPTAGNAVVPSLTNGILIVSVADYEFGGNTALDGISSDQDGALTQLGSNVNNDFANAQLWYLLNPTNATHSLTPSYGDSLGDNPTSLIAHWWSGVDQTTPWGTPATNTGTSDSPTVTATTATGEVVVDSLAVEPSASITPGPDQTEIASNAATDGSGSIRGDADYQAGADGGVMSYTIGISRDWAIIAASLKPAAAATATTRRLINGGLINNGLINGGLI